jgi:hypothetical protein
MDSQDIIGPHDRIELLVAGVKLTARPIEFEFDAGKNPIRATRYETTCPKCGDLIQFFGVMKSVGCTSCGATEAKAVESRVLIRQGAVTRRKSDNQAQRGCPFIDPVEAGAFRVGDTPGE